MSVREYWCVIVCVLESIACCSVLETICLVVCVREYLCVVCI